MLSDRDKALVRILQEDISVVPRPFREVGRKVGMTEDEVLRRIAEWKEDGTLRRFVSVVQHRRLGFRANAMGAWRVPADRIEEVGRIMASFSEVSHCYERATASGWTYNMFTMIHGETQDECERVARAISARTRVTEYRLLYSTKEWKKTSMRYFVEE